MIELVDNLSCPYAKILLLNFVDKHLDGVFCTLF